MKPCLFQRNEAFSIIKLIRLYNLSFSSLLYQNFTFFCMISPWETIDFFIVKNQTQDEELAISKIQFFPETTGRHPSLLYFLYASFYSVLL